ncbi:MAG: mechanosensitive ion channel family protein [Vicingaceae bacterium]
MAAEAIQQNENLEKTAKFLDKADSIRKADSLQTVRLQEELENVRSSDKKRMSELRAKLDSSKAAANERNRRIERQVDSLRKNVQGVPLIFNEDTLFYVYSKLGPFKPKDRANSIRAKIQKLADGYKYSTDSFNILHSEESSDLLYGSIIVLSITDRDAFFAKKRRQDVTIEYEQVIIEAIQKYKDDNNLLKNFLRILLTLGIIAALYFLVRKMNQWFSRFVIYLSRRSHKYLKGVKIREYEVLTIERQEGVLLWLLGAFKWVVIVAILYLAVPLIFSIFPATEDIARTLIGYVTRPVVSTFWSFVGFIPEMITITVIVTITHYVVKGLKFLKKEVENEALKIPGFYPDWASPTFSLLRIIIYAFAFIVIFPYLPGSNSPVFQGVSVFLGLLISLGSSSAISNIIAGLVITYMRPFKIGDRVKIGEVVGDVIEKTMLVTRVKTIKNEDITIPNASILSGHTINYSTIAKEEGLILHTTITIGYDVHWQKVRDCMMKAADMTSHLLKDPKPFVLQTSLDDFYVSYQINAYTRDSSKSAVIYSELHSNILDIFHQAGIEIMSPHYRAERDGSPLAVPSKD